MVAAYREQSELMASLSADESNLEDESALAGMSD